jgi:hypothetical protein
MSEIRLALLGPEIEHHDSLQAAWQAATSQPSLLPWVPDSHTFRRKQQACAAGLTTKLLRKLEPLLWGTRERSYLDFVLNALDQNNTQVLLAYWGTMPLADVLALRRARPRLKLILLALCYPLALTTPGVWRQRLAVWRAAGALDGVICPTPEMQRYLQTHDLRGQKHIHFGVVPPCWPLSFQVQARSPAASSSPNVIFTGRTDISGSTAHAADDLRPLLRGLLDAGIELHHASAKEVDDAHPLRRPFDAMSLPALIQKMSAHDASLIAYNTAACQRVERFTFTVPDRLISSVCAGVPIAIAATGYEASKTYLADYPAVLTFKSPEDLKAQLSDRARIQSLRDAAWLLRKKYSAEAQGDRLLRLVQQVMAE